VAKLQAMADTLARILPRIARFAREHSLESFAQSFDAALACLRSDQPLQAAFHRDIAPRGSLSLQAEQLLGAAQAAWVFGGMGSWNDLSFEAEAGERYTQLSDALYHHLNLAAVAAANTSFGGQDTG
jgi:hypothetical protein